MFTVILFFSFPFSFLLSVSSIFSCFILYFSFSSSSSTPIHPPLYFFIFNILTHTLERSGSDRATVAAVPSMNATNSFQGKGARKFALNLKRLENVFMNRLRVVGLWNETQMVPYLKIVTLVLIVGTLSSFCNCYFNWWGGGAGLSFSPPFQPMPMAREWCIGKQPL
jgi:hypothetical protein